MNLHRLFPSTDLAKRLRKLLQWASLRLAAALLLVIVILSLLPARPAHVEPTDDAGYALSFDGNNDFVRLHSTSQMLHAGWVDTKSVSMWIKPQGTTTCILLDPAKCNSIFGGQPRAWGISIGAISGVDKIWVWNFDGNYDRIGIDYTIGEWVHVTLVHSGNVLRAYRNGFQVGDVPSGATDQPGTGGDSVLYLGGLIVGPTENWSFAGEIDEVRIWNYGRSTTEVQQDMYHELNGDESGLLVYYKMSDGSGEVLTDDTGNGWNGSLKDGGSGVPPDGQLPQWIISTAFSDTFPTPTNTLTPTNTPTVTPTESSGTVTGTPPSPTAIVSGTPPSPTATVTGTPPTPTRTPSPTVTGTRPTPTPIVGDDDRTIYLPVIHSHVAP